MKHKNQIFVSFSSRDLKYVREIMAALSQQNISYWDYSDIAESIELGDHIADRLFEEIDKATHIIVVLSKHAVDPEIGHWCRVEFEYATSTKFSEPKIIIPVVLSAEKAPDLFQTPYNNLRHKLHYEFSNTPESVVDLSMKICNILEIEYRPLIQAHPNLPFWEFFRKEVEAFSQSNNIHAQLLQILGRFNEHYKNNDYSRSLFLIKHFLNHCKYHMIDYQPFYPYLVKAVCETDISDYEEALTTYKYAESLKPHDQNAIGGKGSVYYKMGRFRDALDCFEKIIQNPDVKENENARINSIITKICFNQPLSKIEKKFLLGFDPNKYADDLKVSILNAQGVLYRMQKKYDTLIKHSLRIIEEDIHDTITIRLLVLAYLETGKMDKARDVIEKAISESRTNPRLDKSDLDELFKMINNLNTDIFDY